MRLIPPMLALLDAALDLKVIPRSGWLLAGVARAESVADHSYVTALLALALADEINRDPAAHLLDAPLDVERLLRMALLHDLAESRTTDLPRRATLLLGTDVKHAAERRALIAILDGHPDAAAWLALSDDYANDSSREALLLHDCDKLEMTCQAVRYFGSGNRNLEEFLAPRPYAFALCDDLHRQIIARSLPARGP